MGDYVQLVRCRYCGHQTDAIKETDEGGNPRFIAPENCPTCSQPLVYDVLGPLADIDLDAQRRLIEEEAGGDPDPLRGLVEPGTGDQDTPTYPPVAREEAGVVKVINVTTAAYWEAHTLGLDLRTVTPTGAHNVITVGDVHDALAKAAGGEVGV